MTSLLKDRQWAAVAAVVGFATTALYVALIVSEGNSIVASIPWAVSMVIGSGLAFAATQIADTRLSSKLLVATTAIFAVIGTLAIFSIGLGFLVAAAAALMAVIRLG